ncbi:MAG: hypothetical protein IKH77_04405 [Clostridia bacterium]|nr:hypothetical protein [Clostridia bacterium]
MKTYEEILAGYRKRQRNTLVDTIAASLTYADEVAVETGLLEQTGLMTELTSAVTGVLPFVIIAATEGTKVILGRKPGATGLKDGAFRMVKTGVAMGVGAAVMSTVGLAAAIPVTVGVRFAFDHYKSKAMTSHRVKERTQRLNQLSRQLQNAGQETQPSLPETGAGIPVTAAIQ